MSEAETTSVGLVISQPRLDEMKLVYL